MKKDLVVIYNEKLIKEAIGKLNRNKIHVLYFSYSFNFHNFYQNPLLIFTKLLAVLTGKPSIDHVNHICRFIWDEEEGKWNARVFEATMARGMESNDLFDKLKSFQGICYIETLDNNVNKEKAKIFEIKYTGVPYSKELAAMSGIDVKRIDDTIHFKSDGGFCSWLESLFLIDQGIDLSKFQGGNSLEITPADLFLAELGEKKILYEN